MDNKDLIYAVWLADREFITPAEKEFLLRIFGSVKELYEAPDADIKQVAASYEELKNSLAPLMDKDLGRAEAQLRTAEKLGAKPLVYGDELYPEMLSAIPAAPRLLWYHGDPEILKAPCVSIVGTRRCSPYGRWAAREIASRIAACGRVIVSGMAEGIDSISHIGAMAGGGHTIAVLGTGLDQCFPRSNRKLYDELMEKQLLLSEYPFGGGGRGFQFPQRNRIISGLSSAVIVVEAAMKSGSLITAGFAAEQGRDVFAVPGNINQPGSVGTNRLISDGAAAISDLDRIPSLLGIETEARRAALEKASEEERRLLRLVKENGGQAPGTIITIADMPPGQAAALLSSLELKGLVAVHAGRVFARE